MSALSSVQSQRTPEYPKPLPMPSPLVRCRPALDKELPDAARAHLEALRGRGVTTWATYAQGGQWRPGSARGRCGACGSSVLLLVGSGNLRSHTVPSVPCQAAGEAAREGGACPRCSKKLKPLKSGKIGKHYLPAGACGDGGKAPAEILELEVQEPISSVVVRAPGVGVAVWTDRKFTDAFLVMDGTFVKVDAARWASACRG